METPDFNDFDLTSFEPSASSEKKQVTDAEVTQ
jgi:hypothetical protein